jgi:hypothetical protein
LALSSSEKYLLEKQLRRLNSKVCLLKEEDQDIQAELDLKADLVGGVVPTDQLPIDQDIIDALNNANAPDGTNYFTTLADLSSIIPGTLINVVANYSALPAANTVPGEFYWVENAQGTSWLPGGLGGTYYSNGLYYSNGTTWIYTDMPYNATQAEVDGGLNNNKFVTPNTFENAAKWGTKQNTLTFDSTPTNGSTNPVTSDGVFDALALKQDTLTNPVTGTGTSGQVSYWSGTNTQAGSNNLFWDNANGRLGVGTNAPVSPLEVNGNALFKTGATGGTFIGAGAITRYTSLSGINTSAIYLSSPATGNDLFISYIGGSATSNIYMYWNSQGNINTRGSMLLGAADGAGVIAGPSARLHVRGSGTTSATTALLVQNSTPSTLLEVKDNGAATILTSLNVPSITATSNIDCPSYISQGATIGTKFNINPLNTFSGTSGAVIVLNVAHTSGGGFAPTSGTATHTIVNLGSTINQTGGANGITRGLYVNPTLTSAVDWRSIETSNNTGWSIYSAGSAKSYFAGDIAVGTTTPNASAKLQINSTTQGFLPPRMTATEKNAIATPAEGLVIYQTDGTKGLYLYDGAAWRAITII